MNQKNASSAQPVMVDAKDLAARYGVCEKTIRKWTHTRRIPHYKLSRRCVRYSVSECDEVIFQNRINAN